MLQEQGRTGADDEDQRPGMLRRGGVRPGEPFLLQRGHRGRRHLGEKINLNVDIYLTTKKRSKYLVLGSGARNNFSVITPRILFNLLSKV